MKETIRILLQLNEIDIQILETQSLRDAVPLKIRELETQIRALEAQIAAAQKKADDLNHQQTQGGDFVREKTAWIAERESNSKDIKTNKEYQAVQKEVSLAKKEIADRQTLLSTLGDQIAAAQTAVTETSTKHSAEIDSLKTKIAEQQKILDDMHPQVEARLVERNAIEAQIDAKALQLYNHVRSRQITPVLAKAENFGCTECGSRFQPQLYNLLFAAKEPSTCPRCKRIIYVQEILG